MLIRIVGFMLLGGICASGGGYLVWLWMREESLFLMGFTGLLVLGLYGVVVTYQSLPFARAYAAYGGMFVVLSIFWAMFFDGFHPDRWDLVGAVVIISGVLVMGLAPRGAILRFLETI